MEYSYEFKDSNIINLHRHQRATEKQRKAKEHRDKESKDKESTDKEVKLREIYEVSTSQCNIVSTMYGMSQMMIREHIGTCN
jgi:hypothetical protein